MKFSFNIHYADGIAFDQILKSEDEETLTFIQEPQYKPSYDGLIDKAGTFGEWMSKTKPGDIAVFDSVSAGGKGELSTGQMGEILRKRGIKTVGGQKVADAMELDREFGLKVMEQCGIAVPPYKKFKTKEEGIKFVESTGKRYVYKPFGNISTAKTKVAGSAQEMIAYLKKSKDNVPFILQEFVEGIELSTEVIFADGNPMGSNNTIETKNFLPGFDGSAGCGNKTGCMSSVVWSHKDLNNKAVKEGIGRVFAFMKQVKYSGFLDLNSIIDKNGKIYGIEWTCRCGYSGIYAYYMLFREKLSEVFKWIASGKEGGEIVTDKENYGLAVRCSIPPYPLEYDDTNAQYVKPLLKMTAGTSIKIFNDKFKFFFLDVKLQDGELVSAGTDGVVFELGHKAKDLMKAQKEINECLKDDCDIDGLQWRVDMFDRAAREIPKLKALGFYTIE